MSRSYKYPIYKQRNDKYHKKLSNKRIRNYFKTLKIGFKTNKLRILVNPYDICDWKFIPDEDKITIAKRK